MFGKDGEIRSPVVFPLVIDRLRTDVEHGGVVDRDGDERVDTIPPPPPLSIIETKRNKKIKIEI